MKQGQKQKYKNRLSFFLTLTMVNWIDVFTRKNYRDAISNVEVERIC